MVSPATRLHISKLDPQVQDFFFDCVEMFERFVLHETAERWAWLATAEAFDGVWRE